MDAEAFLKLKKDAVIINTARAKLIDQNALYEALKNGQLYGYGSDVHFMEPGFDEELIASEKTVLTPHILSLIHIWWGKLPESAERCHCSVARF